MSATLKLPDWLGDYMTGFGAGVASVGIFTPWPIAVFGIGITLYFVGYLMRNRVATERAE